MKRTFYFLVFTLIYLVSQAQVTGKIRGVVSDVYTQTPLPGVNIVILETNPLLGGSSNSDGNFSIADVPAGRISLQFTAIGYKPVVMKGLLLKGSTELVLEVKMEEDIEVLNEIVVKAGNEKEKTINKMAAVSARSFTIEETERYAGSLGDPSRMAQNFSGVFTAGDHRNDIIIRGNSPAGLLWRLDGVNIPNPNHFGALGSTGGPVSMLNNNLLANSDFFTGAWPAEYGNCLSGVFDLNMRNGNNQQREYVFQIGFNGYELGAEGPFSKNHQSSYLINYRYSTLDVMDKIGFDVANGAVPQYQDLSFKINMPTAKAGRFSLTGILGKSGIFFDHRANNDGIYSNAAGVDTRNGTAMMTINLGHTYFVNEKSRFESYLNLSGGRITTTVDSIAYEGVNNDSIVKTQFFHENNSELHFAAGTRYRTKINARNFIDAGISADVFYLNYIDSVKVGRYYGWGESSYIRQTEIDTGNVVLLQGFTQWKHRFNNNLTFVGGLHYQQLSMNNSLSVEPRTSLSWQFTEKQSLSAGYGMHSQMQSMYLYFVKVAQHDIPGTYIQNNVNLGFTRAHHAVISYHYTPIPDFRIKAEAYYQYLYDVPVQDTPTAISVLNSGASFYQWRFHSLVNQGTGRNYGIELTIEKFFSKQYYFLVTASLFESKYTTKQNIERNTLFANNYVVNALAGYEFKIGKKGFFSIDLRGVFAGGLRYLPIDEVRSAQENTVIYNFDSAYEKRTTPYFRTDLRLSFKTIGKKVTQEWALDLQNLSGNKNVYALNWDNVNNRVYQTYQQGFYPMFLYRLNF